MEIFHTGSKLGPRVNTMQRWGGDPMLDCCQVWRTGLRCPWVAAVWGFVYGEYILHRWFNLVHFSAHYCVYIFQQPVQCMENQLCTENLVTVMCQVWHKWWVLCWLPAKFLGGIPILHKTFLAWHVFFQSGVQRAPWKHPMGLWLFKVPMTNVRHCGAFMLYLTQHIFRWGNIHPL